MRDRRIQPLRFRRRRDRDAARDRPSGEFASSRHRASARHRIRRRAGPLSFSSSRVARLVKRPATTTSGFSTSTSSASPESFGNCAALAGSQERARIARIGAEAENLRRVGQRHQQLIGAQIDRGDPRQFGGLRAPASRAGRERRSPRARVAAPRILTRMMA